MESTYGTSGESQERKTFSFDTGWYNFITPFQKGHNDIMQKNYVTNDEGRIIAPFTRFDDIQSYLAGCEFAICEKAEGDTENDND